MNVQFDDKVRSAKRKKEINLNILSLLFIEPLLDFILGSTFHQSQLSATFYQLIGLDHDLLELTSCTKITLCPALK